jgi:hypothetical protein
MVGSLLYVGDSLLLERGELGGDLVERVLLQLGLVHRRPGGRRRLEHQDPPALTRHLLQKLVLPKEKVVFISSSFRYYHLIIRIRPL